MDFLFLWDRLKWLCVMHRVVRRVFVPEVVAFRIFQEQFCFFLFFLNMVICSLEIRADVRFYAFSVLFSVLYFKVVEPEGVGLQNVLALILQRNMVNSWRCASQEELTNISIYFPNRRFYGYDLIQLYEALCSSRMGTGFIIRNKFYTRKMIILKRIIMLNRAKLETNES